MLSTGIDVPDDVKAAIKAVAEQVIQEQLEKTLASVLPELLNASFAGAFKKFAEVQDAKLLAVEQQLKTSFFEEGLKELKSVGQNSTKERLELAHSFVDIATKVGQAIKSFGGVDGKKPSDHAAGFGTALMLGNVDFSDQQSVQQYLQRLQGADTKSDAFRKSFSSGLSVVKSNWYRKQVGGMPAGNKLPPKKPAGLKVPPGPAPALKPILKKATPGKPVLAKTLAQKEHVL